MVIPVEFNKQNMGNEWDLSKKHDFLHENGDHFSMEDLACCLVLSSQTLGEYVWSPKNKKSYGDTVTPRSNTSYPDAIVDDYWRLCSRKKADIMMENGHIRRTPETFTWGKHPLLTIIGLGRQGRCSVTQNTSFAIEK